MKKISPLGHLVKNNELHCLKDNGIIANRKNTCTINDIIFIHNNLFRSV